MPDEITVLSHQAIPSRNYSIKSTPFFDKDCLMRQNLARVADVLPHRRVRETRRQRKDKETGSNAQAHFGSPFEHDVKSTHGYSLIGRHICEM